MRGLPALLLLWQDHRAKSALTAGTNSCSNLNAIVPEVLGRAYSGGQCLETRHTPSPELGIWRGVGGPALIKTFCAGCNSEKAFAAASNMRRALLDWLCTRIRAMPKLWYLTGYVT